MTARTSRARLERAAAEAALAVPGVAFLRPGIADVLRGATGQRPGSCGGVRARAAEGSGGWRIDVQLAVLRGHRAVDVTRAVRAAVEAAAETAAGAAATGGRPVRAAVTVTVTAIV
ncbi:Asp23/Gls24 family envelope stress response protein [Streptomyces enissocaesilis]|uniref:Asp23/Gls24 family envelope stress response protein n=1 Tax=Streptomyces enissocaesilis TaxID=332589 RepID=A0ABN3XBR3_9ACTN